MSRRFGVTRSENDVSELSEVEDSASRVPRPDPTSAIGRCLKSPCHLDKGFVSPGLTSSMLETLSAADPNSESVVDDVGEGVSASTMGAVVETRI
jgi:hypothetical protein